MWSQLPTTTYGGCGVKCISQLLFSLGHLGVVDTAYKKSTVGKLTPSALYVHRSAISETSRVLRLYEGCARGYLGRIEGANIVKLHHRKPMVSYLSYPEFDKSRHPPLAWALTVHLQTFHERWRNYMFSENRPILRRKELFVSPDYPAYRKFKRLSGIEERKGLYRDTQRIGFENGWNAVLAQKGHCLKGHRLLSTGRRDTLRRAQDAARISRTAS